jgi:hypothetical protein
VSALGLIAMCVGAAAFLWVLGGLATWYGYYLQVGSPKPFNWRVLVSDRWYMTWLRRNL